jgi:pilus assembly protein CpaF
MLTVTIREKDGEERRLMFQEEEVTVGRAKGSDIMLPRNNISKRHARLVDKDDKVVLVDLRSTNGTYVNGRRITAPEIITPADKIYIGDFIIRVEAAAAPARAMEEMESTQALDLAMLEAAASGGPTEAVGAEAAMQQAIAQAAREAAAEADALAAKTRAAAVESAQVDHAWDDMLESTQALDLSAVEAIDQATAAETVDSRPEPEPVAELDAVAALEAELEFELDPEPEPAPEPRAVAPQPVAQVYAPQPVAQVYAPQPVAQVYAPQPQATAAQPQATVAQPQATAPPAAVRVAPGPAALPKGGLSADGLRDLLADPSVEHILVNSFDSVVVSQNGRSSVLAQGFESRAALDRAVSGLLASANLSGDPESGITDITLPGGESLHVVPRSLAPSGPIVTIRRQRAQALALADLVASRALTQQGADYLASAVAARRNIAIVGAPGSGRTTVANALAATLAPDERILVVADARELSLAHRNVMHLDKAPLHDSGHEWATVAAELLAQRVVIDPMAPSDLASAVALALGGHDGLLLTATAPNAHAFLRRTTLQLALYAGGISGAHARAVVAELINVVVVVTRQGSTLRVTEILSVEGPGPEELQTMEILGRG